jgi:hypothetical protein
VAACESLAGAKVPALFSAVRLVRQVTASVSSCKPLTLIRLEHVDGRMVRHSWTVMMVAPPAAPVAVVDAVPVTLEGGAAQKRPELAIQVATCGPVSVATFEARRQLREAGRVPTFRTSSIATWQPAAARVRSMPLWSSRLAQAAGRLATQAAGLVDGVVEVKAALVAEIVPTVDDAGAAQKRPELATQVAICGPVSVSTFDARRQLRAAGRVPTFSTERTAIWQSEAATCRSKPVCVERLAQAAGKLTTQDGDAVLALTLAVIVPATVPLERDPAVARLLVAEALRVPDGDTPQRTPELMMHCASEAPVARLRFDVRQSNEPGSAATLTSEFRSLKQASLNVVRRVPRSGDVSRVRQERGRLTTHAASVDDGVGSVSDGTVIEGSESDGTDADSESDESDGTEAESDSDERGSTEAESDGTESDGTEAESDGSESDGTDAESDNERDGSESDGTDKDSDESVGTVTDRDGTESDGTETDRDDSDSDGTDTDRDGSESDGTDNESDGSERVDVTEGEAVVVAPQRTPELMIHWVSEAPVARTFRFVVRQSSEPGSAARLTN